MATTSQKSPPAAPAPPAKPLALRWRVLITLAILLHLTAIIAAPLAVWPSSELQQNLAETFRPYICAAYLDHGYRFFAPMPSPGHLVRYTLQMPDGTSQTGTFPDLKTEWPRLFYHRHFMLSEKLAQFYDPDQPGANDPPAARAQWQAERKTFEAIAKSYADYLLRTSGAKQITLQYVQHDLPSYEELQQDHPLDDPQKFRVLWTGTFTNDSL